jgi:predicted amidohydrolase YtcJ
MQALSIHDDSDVIAGGKLERDGDNRLTGVVVGNGNTLGKIFDRLPKPTLEQQVDGSRKFFREMNSLGITGIVDGGGVSMYPANYQAVFKLWHDRQLTLRVAYHLCAPKPGSELADLQDLMQLLPQGFGDAMLHFNGPGEILIWADWTDGDITPDGKAKLSELLRWAASKVIPSSCTGIRTAPSTTCSMSSKTWPGIIRCAISAGLFCTCIMPRKTV